MFLVDNSLLSKVGDSKKKDFYVQEHINKTKKRESLFISGSLLYGEIT